MTDRVRVNREQIARVVGDDPRLIRAFEKLFDAVFQEQADKIADLERRLAALEQ